jgi:MFS family permease
MLCLAGSYDLVVFRVRQELRQPAVVVGVLWGLGTLGAIAGGILASRLRRWLGFGVPFFAGLALQGLSFLAIGGLSNLWLLVACGVGVTFGDILVVVLGQAVLQEETPDDLQGRVTATMQAGIWLATAAGAAASTSLAALLGSTSPVFLVTGLLLALAGGSFLTPARRRLSETPISLSHSAG